MPRKNMNLQGGTPNFAGSEDICVITNIRQGLLKDGQESFSKIYKLFSRRYMPKPH